MATNKYSYKRWTNGIQPKRYLAGNADGCRQDFMKKLVMIASGSKKWGSKIEENLIGNEGVVHMRKWNSETLSGKLFYRRSKREVAKWLMEGTLENPPEKLDDYISGFDWSDPKANETLQARFNEWKWVHDTALKDAVHVKRNLPNCYTSF